MNKGKASDNKLGGMLMIGAMAGFAVEDLFTKYMGAYWSPMQILMVLGFTGGCIYALVAWRMGVNVFARKNFRRNALLRMFFEVIGTLCFASSVILGSLSLSSTIIQAMPILVTMGAAIFFKETVGWRRWTAIFVGLLGVMLVIEPWGAEYNPYSLLALVGVIGLSARDLVTRTFDDDVDSLALATWGFWILTPASLLLWPFGMRFASAPSHIYGLLALALAGGLIGYYLLIRAMRVGDISVVTPFRYSRLIFGGALGVLFLGERLSVSAIIGAVIIVSMGIYTFWRENHLAKHAEHS